VCVCARGPVFKSFSLFIEAETPAKSTGWERDPDKDRFYPDKDRFYPDIDRLLSTGKKHKLTLA